MLSKGWTRGDLGAASFFAIHIREGDGDATDMAGGASDSMTVVVAVFKHF